MRDFINFIIIISSKFRTSNRKERQIKGRRIFSCLNFRFGKWPFILHKLLFPVEICRSWFAFANFLNYSSDYTSNYPWCYAIVFYLALIRLSPYSELSFVSRALLLINFAHRSPFIWFLLFPILFYSVLAFSLQWKYVLLFPDTLFEHYSVCLLG